MLEQWSEGKGTALGVHRISLKPGTLDRGGISRGTYGEGRPFGASAMRADCRTNIT